MEDTRKGPLMRFIVFGIVAGLISSTISIQLSLPLHASLNEYKLYRYSTHSAGFVPRMSHYYPILNLIDNLIGEEALIQIIFRYEFIKNISLGIGIGIALGLAANYSRKKVTSLVLAGFLGGSSYTIFISDLNHLDPFFPLLNYPSIWAAFVGIAIAIASMRDYRSCLVLSVGSVFSAISAYYCVRIIHACSVKPVTAARNATF